MGKVLRSEIYDAREQGGSDYLLLDDKIKRFLEVGLKEPFDAKKHGVKVELTQNKRGDFFIAFWFVKK